MSVVQPLEGNAEIPIRKGLRNSLAEQAHPVASDTKEQDEENGDFVYQREDGFQNTERRWINPLQIVPDQNKGTFTGFCPQESIELMDHMRENLLRVSASQ